MAVQLLPAPSQLSILSLMLFYTTASPLIVYHVLYWLHFVDLLYWITAIEKLRSVAAMHFLMHSHSSLVSDSQGN